MAITFIALVLFAVFFAYAWGLHGVRTDEAKYLLNIPYPQPPLMRWLLSQTELLPFQEAFWRFLFASLLLQSVWIVWWMGHGLSLKQRLFLSMGWLLSASIVTWAGSILMAPLTAFQALVLIALTLRSSSLERYQCFSFLLGFFWLCSLFTAYQIVLYFPLFAFLVYRVRRSFIDVIVYGVFPIGIVLFYALANPLSMASFVNAGSENLDLPFFSWWWYLLRTWITGGSIAFMILGMLGMGRARDIGLIGSLILVSAFVFLSFRDYYDLYFTPLFIGGTAQFLRSGGRPTFFPVVSVAALTTVVTLWYLHPSFVPSTARTVMQTLQYQHISGDVLINGAFGHQWQYESRLPIRRYSSGSLAESRAVVCLDSCDGMDGSWRKLERMPVEVWVPRSSY